MKTIRLEFNDRNDTVLYLCCVQSITIRTSDWEFINGVDVTSYKLIFSADGPGINPFVELKYDTKNQRDIDYRYAIQMSDELMGVEGE